MIRVKFEDTRNGSVGSGAVTKIAHLAAVPRVGDSIHWNEDDGGFYVKGVLWIVDDNDDAEYDVIVRGW